MISDLSARANALDPQKSFIVQAPAGSGKTGLLVYRLLTLLATVDQPQQVLAITFTRKATAEMRERLLYLMHVAEAGESSEDVFEQQGIDLAKKVLERDAEKGWNLLNTPHQLQLLTIDSFCAKLTASMPWLSRLGDRPRTTNQADVHYAAAVESLLNELLNEDSMIAEPLKTVLLELDFNYNRARLLFSSMLAKRDQWLRHLLQNDLPSLRTALEQAWADVIAEQIDQLETALSDGTIAQLVKLALHASQNIKVSEGQESFLAPFSELDVSNSEGDNNNACLYDESVNELPVDKLNVEQWQALCRLVLLADGKGFRKTVTIKQGFVAKSAEKEKMLALLTEFADDGVLRELMFETTLLPQAQFTDQGWQQLLSLEIVLKALAAFLQLRFRSSGECDHNEVTQRANLALQELDNPTDLGLRMDYHIHHILVDEFQDTSNGQIELLKRLTSGWIDEDAGAPKTLFLVGDPMQSIYRFREADVSLFLQVVNNQQTQIFENLNIESLSLTENFRSSHDLVQWFNDTFEKSFPQKNNVLTGAINYASASSNKTDVKGDVVYQLAHSKQQEAMLLVEQVQLTISEQKMGDKVAILVRTRGQLKTILPALQEAGISYAGVDIQPLAEQQAVIDVLSLCKAICREDDRVSWMALLRGPWCGLTLGELKYVACRNDITIWQQLNDSTVTTQFAADTAQRLKRFMMVLEDALVQRQQVELGSLSRWAWRTLGGEQTLLGASVDDIETVFNLIDDLQRGGDLPSINDLDKALQGLYAAPSVNAHRELDAQPKVVVSTMHKSKGLQYDTVILPGLSNRPRVDDREIMMWAEHQNKQGMSNLLLAPLRLGKSTGAHFEYLRKLESKRAGNEAIRLMYVAVTRAERKLVLLANADTNEETGETKAPASSSLLATLWEELNAKFSFPLESIQDEQSTQVLSQNLIRLNSRYKKNYLEPVQWQVAQQLNAQQAEAEEVSDDEQEDSSQRYDWATNAASGVGTVLHGWLQYNGANVLTVQIDQAQISGWRTELIALRVPNTHIEYAVRNLKQAIENIKVDHQAHFIFDTYAIEQNEYALSAFDDGVVKKSIIDRTFVDDKGTRWIVDYKSTPTKNKDLQAFAQEQVKTRHQSQLERYGALMSEIDSRPIQLAVYFPLIKQLVCWPYKPETSK